MLKKRVGRPGGIEKLASITVPIAGTVKDGITDAATFEGKRPAALARELLEEGWSVYGELGSVAFMEHRYAREVKEKRLRKGG